MTDLTEQWKKGKLPSGEYYIIDDLGLHTTDRYYPSHGFGAELPQSVLGRVPSYDEWKAKLEENAQLKSKLQLKETAYDFDTARLEEENAQLKELLKECKHIIGIEKDFASCHFEEYKLVELLTKIDKVLK